jgi:uncharacterized protein YbaR (Trm112 family)
LELSSWQDTDGGQGILTCAPTECRTRFPIIDGLPVLVADLPRFLNEAGAYLLARDDLDEPIADLFGVGAAPRQLVRRHAPASVGLCARSLGALRYVGSRGLPAPGQAWGLAQAGLAARRTRVRVPSSNSAPPPAA